MTKQEKDLLQSPAFWAIIVALATPIASKLGYNIDKTAAINFAIAVVSGGYAMYDHITNATPITSIAGLVTKKSAKKAVQAATNAQKTASGEVNAQS